MLTLARLFNRFFSAPFALYDGEFDPALAQANAPRITQLSDDENDPDNPIAYSYFGA